MTDVVKLTKLKFPDLQVTGLAGAGHVFTMAARARPAPCVPRPPRRLRGISHNGLRAVLSGARWLERSGA
jgi:hypothetical protein